MPDDESSQARGPIGRYHGFLSLPGAARVLLSTFVGTIAAAIPMSLLAGIGFAPSLSCRYTLVGAIAAPVPRTGSLP